MSEPNHRWWHAGSGYKQAFCLFCGAGYLETQAAQHLGASEDCPAPNAIGGEEEAQRILALASLQAVASHGDGKDS